MILLSLDIFCYKVLDITQAVIMSGEGTDTSRTSFFPHFHVQLFIYVIAY